MLILINFVPKVGIFKLTSDNLNYTQVLEKHNFLISLEDVKNYEVSNMYIKDKNEWNHGLYGFHASGQEVVSYYLWRKIGSTLFLLIGSPNNILGDKIVRNGSFVPGTSGAFSEVLSFVKRNLSTDEPTAVTLDPLPHWLDSYEFSLVENVVEETNDKIEVIPKLKVNPREYFETPPGSSRKTIEFYDYFYDLPNFCLSQLKHLPSSRIETVFKIYSVFKNEQSENDKNQITLTVLASPLYVALD